jgi:L-threonylcarbamoyladenylate synthase
MPIIVKQSSKTLKLAIKTLNSGGVVICPTDTVYGFLADASNKKAVAKIFKIKKRLKSKTLPIFVKDLKMAKQITEISKDQEQVLKSKWPGKFTFVLNKKIDIGCLSNLVVAKNGTVALRIPKYKFLNYLLKKVNKPLAQTSVNISADPPMTKIKYIVEIFGNNKLKVDLIIDGGDLRSLKPSKIIDLIDGSKKTIRY